MTELQGVKTTETFFVEGPYATSYETLDKAIAYAKKRSLDYDSKPFLITKAIAKVTVPSTFVVPAAIEAML